MNPEPQLHTEPQTITQKTEAMVGDVKSKTLQTFEVYEEKVRQSPEKAVLIAVAAGYCLQVLPLRVLIGAPIRLALFLAKPTLLALGAAKACEIVQSQTRK